MSGPTAGQQIAAMVEIVKASPALAERLRVFAEKVAELGERIARLRAAYPPRRTGPPPMPRGAVTWPTRRRRHRRPR